MNIEKHQEYELVNNTNYVLGKIIHWFFMHCRYNNSKTVLIFWKKRLKQLIKFGPRMTVNQMNRIINFVLYLS